MVGVTKAQAWPRQAFAGISCALQIEVCSAPPEDFFATIFLPSRYPGNAVL
jgi:hypothetical protein